MNRAAASSASRPSASRTGPAAGTGVEPWPRGVSRSPRFSIGQVVARVRPEFPALRVSKVRYLEERGILSPQRTPSGYRKYSLADIERLRFCLQAQRESFLPLDEISRQLDVLDAGGEAKVEPTARIVASEGKLVTPGSGDVSVSVRELLDFSGIEQDLLDEVVAAGILAPDLAGRFPSRAVTVVRSIATLRRCGIPVRNLRYVALNAQRHVDLIEQVSRPSGRDRSGADKERRLARAGEMAEVLAQLSTALLRMHMDMMD